MNKWFAGCGNVKLFELHKNTLKFIFPSLTNNRCTHVIGLYHEATNYYQNQRCHWFTYCCTTKGTKRKAKHVMNLPDPNKMKTELQNPRELQSLKLTVCRSGNQRIIEIIIVFSSASPREYNSMRQNSDTWLSWYMKTHLTGLLVHQLVQANDIGNKE